MGDPRKSNPWPYVDPTNPNMDQNTSTRSGRDILTPGYDNIGLQMNLALKKLFEGEQKPEPSLLNRGTTPKQPSYVNPEDMNDEQKKMLKEAQEYLEGARNQGAGIGDIQVKIKSDGTIELEGDAQDLKRLNDWESNAERRKSYQENQNQPRQASPSLLARNAAWARQGEAAAENNRLNAAPTTAPQQGNTQGAGTLKPGDPGYEEMMRRLQQARGY